MFVNYRYSGRTRAALWDLCHSLEDLATTAGRFSVVGDLDSEEVLRLRMALAVVQSLLNQTLLLPGRPADPGVADVPKEG